MKILDFLVYSLNLSGQKEQELMREVDNIAEDNGQDKQVDPLILLEKTAIYIIGKSIPIGYASVDPNKISAWGPGPIKFSPSQ